MIYNPLAYEILVDICVKSARITLDIKFFFTISLSFLDKCFLALCIALCYSNKSSSSMIANDIRKYLSQFFWPVGRKYDSASWKKRQELFIVTHLNLWRFQLNVYRFECESGKFSIFLNTDNQNWMPSTPSLSSGNRTILPVQCLWSIWIYV